jgi:transcriptional regulator with XRE-family HTH domain
MAPAPAARFGALLKHYRRAAGLTQEALAEQARLSVRGIQDLERGVSQAAPAALPIRLSIMVRGPRR